MAYGTANVDTIQSSTAGTPVQFNDGNGTQVGTLCRAWVNFNGGNGNTAGVINASFNVSSVTRTALGNYTINLTNAMPDANYVVANNHQYANSSGGSDDVYGGWLQNKNPTTSEYYVFSRSASSNNIDVFKFHSAIFR